MWTPYNGGRARRRCFYRVVEQSADHETKLFLGAFLGALLIIKNSRVSIHEGYKPFRDSGSRIRITAMAIPKTRPSPSENAGFLLWGAILDLEDARAADEPAGVHEKSALGAPALLPITLPVWTGGGAMRQRR